MRSSRPRLDSNPVQLGGREAAHRLEGVCPIGAVLHPVGPSCKLASPWPSPIAYAGVVLDEALEVRDVLALALLLTFGGPLAGTLPFEGFFSKSSQIETSGSGLGRAEAGARGLNLGTP